jgi:hypothetical protein
MMDPHEHYLRSVLSDARIAHRIDGSGTDATAHLTMGSTPDNAVPIEVDLQPRALRFTVRNIPVDLGPPRSEWLLEGLTRRWLLGRIHRNPESDAVELVLALYVGSGYPPAALIHWVLAHMVEAARMLLDGHSPKIVAPEGARATLDDVASVVARLGLNREWSEDRRSFGVRLNGPDGRGVTLQFNLENVNLLSVRGAPLLRRAWGKDEVSLQRMSRLNSTLSYGHIEYEPGLGFLMYRAVVNVDWAPLDDELMQFLIDSAMQVAPQLVHPMADSAPTHYSARW